MRISRIFTTLAAVVALGVGSIAAPEVADAASVFGRLTVSNDVMGVATRCTDLANWYRAARTKVDGIARPALVIDYRVQMASQLHSNQQASMIMMTHDGYHKVATSATAFKWVMNTVPTRSAGYRITTQKFVWSAWGENVAAGQLTCDVVVKAWMNSPHHRDNILDPRFTRIGMSARKSPQGVTFWTMDLARAL
jgi:uncharacterized protein YkwD